MRPLVEASGSILSRKYGPLTKEKCQYLLDAYDARDFVQSGDIRERAQLIASQSDLPKDAVFSRICGFLRYVSGQFLEEKEKQLLSTRLRTFLLRREIAADFKRLLWALSDRKGLDKPWKPEGVTFLQSLP